MGCASRSKVRIKTKLILVEDGDVLAMKMLAMVGYDAKGIERQMHTKVGLTSGGGYIP